MIQNLIFGYLESFFENIVSVSCIQLFYIRPHVSVDIIRFLFHCYYYFNFLSKSQNQKILGKKFTNFIIQFCSKNLTHFMNLNSHDIENNMLSQHSQKPFSLCKFSSQNICVWCRKKHLHCIFSWRPSTSLLKNYESKCLYISVYLHKNISVPDT